MQAGDGLGNFRTADGKVVRGRSLTQGLYNTSAIAASATVDAITLVNNGGADWHMLQYRLTYNAAVPLQARAYFSLYHAQKNYFPINGLNVLGAYAFPASGMAVLSMARIIWNDFASELILPQGQSMILKIVTPAGVAFAAGDLGLSIDGWVEQGA